MTRPSPTRPRIVAAVLLAILPGLAGCRMPSASLQLLDGLDVALDNVSSGNKLVRDSMVRQLQSQQDSLDTAFEVDLRNLSANSPARPPATTGPDDEPSIRLADVLAAKRLFDLRRVELAASRANVTETFDRLDNNLTASRQIAGMLRRLVLQQNVLAGQADLAIQTLLSSRASSPASAIAADK